MIDANLTAAIRGALDVDALRVGIVDLAIVCVNMVVS